MAKLIILRGPSASGKSTVAKEIQKRHKNVAVVEQDHINLHYYKIADREETSAARHEITKQSILTSLRHGHDVIAEGIYGGSWIATFKEIMIEHPEENHVFYFDISLDETVRRHAGRDKAKIFSAEQMSKWYNLAEKFGHVEEVIITEDMSKDKILELVEKTCKFSKG